jgi:chromate reductase, NAD(P)H dehydrogenase (quinone)
MRLLAISGSTRRASTNTALLRALQAIAPSTIVFDVFDGLGDLPVFSPDLEGAHLPDSVGAFLAMVSACDGLLFSSPEYVRTLPGGLKNAIDWLVSGDQVVGKPIALVHASHRGDDMLGQLRIVLKTVSANFNGDLFFRLPVMKETPEAISEILRSPANRSGAEQFLQDFSAFCRNCGKSAPGAFAL